MTKNKTQSQTLSTNRRARFDYHIEQTLEAGIVLTGSEVKSLRSGKSSIQEAYAAYDKGDLVLVNAYIAEYSKASIYNHEERRTRKLLVHKKEAKKWGGAVQKEGMTIVPISMYFNSRGKVKIELGLAQGKKNVDRRQTIKEREWQRDKARILRTK